MKGGSPALKKLFLCNVCILMLVLLLGVSCSRLNYEKEIVGVWATDEITLFFLSSGDIVHDNSPELPIGYGGTYSVDKDGIVTIQLVGTEEKETLQMSKEGDDWYFFSPEENKHVATKESSDVSYWEKIINNLDNGDRLEGSWSGDLEYGHNTIVYHDGGSYEMVGKDYYDGTYTAYYGKEALSFLVESEEALMVPISDFHYTDGTFYADEVVFSDGGTMVDYGFLSGKTMETACTRDDHEPVYYYKD